MGRHRTAEEKRELGERARAMRAAGRSQREIQRELGIGDDLARQLLAGTEVPDALRRPRAKDDVRAEAVVLRGQGLTYDEIAAELHVSKSSLSLWLRDLPRPEVDPERARMSQERRLRALRARIRRDRDERDEEGRQARAAVASALGVVTARDLVLALAVSYWCEGTKSKPWNRAKAIRWMNSDPVLVMLFLEALVLLGIERERLSLRLHIHESADEAAARAWWAEWTGVPMSQFMSSTIKRHNPKTVRQNVGPDYRGCLCVSVLQGRTLYEALSGLVEGLATMPRELEGWHDGPRPGGATP
jgi:transcriptional regulator with XRE-family HTH domain